FTSDVSSSCADDHGEHRVLHSFPARRSSDLSPAAEEGGIVLRHCPFLDLARDHPQVVCSLHCGVVEGVTGQAATIDANPGVRCVDRKSTRLNSSHVDVSYAVLCLIQKNGSLA